MIIAYSPYAIPSNTTQPFNKIYEKAVPADQGLLCSDALLLFGGTDIHPAFYKEKAHPKTQTQHTYPINERDLTEWHLMHLAKKRGIPIIGVCRGAQFLCVFAGGSLIQHVTGHNQSHDVLVADSLKGFHAPADHHQMMEPISVDHELLGWSIKHSTIYENGEREQVSTKYTEEGIEPEVMWFPEIKGFAIQPHPEWGPAGTQFNEWLLQQLKKRI